ncbi:hypothetical protein HHK36_001907 [Tetracentron sinense]|uniref:Tyrosinase copper-binding domain-containing protein n=1 Tax=Tetracentron sinense TaxID=13715 RepID=A0A835DS09_TETSI|nr:hypothetical protein HHK36_001907 [Tetracentron sinense]
MASLLSTTTTNTTITASYSPFPFYQKRSRASLVGTRSYSFVRKLSCKARNGDQKPTQGSDNGETSPGRMDRRNVLIGLGGMYGAAGLSPDQLAFGAPILPPDISACGPANISDEGPTVACCPPLTSKIVDFELPSSSTPLRVRPAAHKVDAKYLAKYSKALSLMKALPDDDPRSFKNIANVHCAYCNGAYDQVGFPDLELSVHFCWLFFPFHRYYLYFYEKILGKLIGDPTFAIPFWNWDSPPGMTIPAIYTDSNYSLYDQYREAKHQPPTLVDLDYSGTETTVTGEKQILSNLSVMYRQMVSGSTTAQLFFGDSYRAGDTADPGAGTLESTPHNSIHRWVGDSTQTYNEDMGNFYSAGRDPLFYGHHANVDRMWTIWKGLGGKRKDFTDSDWLNSAFLFYDENKQLVRVKVKDCLNQKDLRYTYEDVEIPWLKSRPTPRKAKATSESTTATSVEFPKVLDSVVRTVVERPKKKKRSTKEKEDEEEILLITGIELEKDVYVKFDVFINDVDETVISPDNTEFAGSFVNLPHKHGKREMKAKTNLRLALTELLEDLEAEDDESVVVTLVPRQGKATIGGIKIVFAS